MGWLLGLVRMTRVAFILRTNRGANALSFDSLERAQAAKAIHESRVKVPFQIVRQTITEDVIA
jgi:hypothetical protein